jgi:uncharacterized protein
MSCAPQVATRRIGTVPTLLVSHGGTLGTVLLFHGLGAHKEANLPELHQLASAGFVAVGVDAVGHGARRYPDFEQRFASSSGPDAPAALYEVVEQTVAEIPQLVDGLAREGLCAAGRLGIAGVSMGGYITFGALLAERRFSAAVSLIGSPLWRPCAERSPHLYPERFPPVALLIQTAGKDSSVPPEQARDFHARLRPHYRPFPERLRYEELPDAVHIMSAAEWQRMITNMVDWFRLQLRG